VTNNRSGLCKVPHKVKYQLRTYPRVIDIETEKEQKETRKAKKKKKSLNSESKNGYTGLSVHVWWSSNGFSRNSGSSRSVELSVVLSECVIATRGALILAPAPAPVVAGDCDRTSDIGRFGNRPSLLKSTPPGMLGVVPFAPAIVGENDRTGGVVEDGTELGGDDTGEVYDGRRLVSDCGGGGLSACGGVVGLCAAAVAEGVVLSLS